MTIDASTDFKLRYVGDRFKGARLPFDVLADLPAFGELIAAFAEARWWELNPDRKRLTKGFDQIFRFSMSGLEDGSAMPNISWDSAMPVETLPGIPLPHADLVVASFKQVVDLFDSAGTGSLPENLSRGQLRAIDKFGSSLKDEERIEFYGTTGFDGKVVYLDNYRRKKIITNIKDTYQKKIVGTGRLVANFEDGALSVRTTVYGDIKIPMSGAEVALTFDGNLGSPIYYDLLADLDRNDKLKTVAHVNNVHLLEDESLGRCFARFSELEQLQSGWHDGEGSPIAAHALANAKSFITQRPTFADSYRIYPTLDSGVQIEFLASGWDFTLEFLSTGAVEFYGVELDGADELSPLIFEDEDERFYHEFDRRVGGVEV